MFNYSGNYNLAFIIITRYKHPLDVFFSLDSHNVPHLLRHVLEWVGKGFLAERKLADRPDLGVLH